MRKLVIITLVLSLVLVGCTGQDAAKNTTNAPDSDIGENYEDWSSHTDPYVSMEGITSDHVTSDPTMPTSTAPDPSENNTERNEPAGSLSETDSAETQSPQQATETPSTSTASLGETKPMPITPPETTFTQPTEQEIERLIKAVCVVAKKELVRSCNPSAKYLE